MRTEFPYFSGYEISYRPLNAHVYFSTIVEDPECLQMEVDMLLEQYDELKIRKVIKWLKIY